MNKQTAIKAFGSVAALAAGLGISRQAVYKWPEELPQDQIDRISGAALRLGVTVDSIAGRHDTGIAPEQEAA